MPFVITLLTKSHMPKQTQMCRNVHVQFSPFMTSPEDNKVTSNFWPNDEHCPTRHLSKQFY